MSRKTVKLIHKGKYVAEVPVELIEDEGGWSPYLSLEDAKKLERCAWRCTRARCGRREAWPRFRVDACFGVTHCAYSGD